MLAESAALPDPYSRENAKDVRMGEQGAPAAILQAAINHLLCASGHLLESLATGDVALPDIPPWMCRLYLRRAQALK